MCRKKLITFLSVLFLGIYTVQSYNIYAKVNHNTKKETILSQGTIEGTFQEYQIGDYAHFVMLDKNNKTFSLYDFDYEKRQKQMALKKGQKVKVKWKRVNKYIEPAGGNLTINVLESVEKIQDKTVNINEYHPIVFAYDINKGVFGETFVIGGSKAGKWYRIDDFKLPSLTDPSKQIPNVKVDLVKGNERYKFYKPYKFLGESNGTKAKFWISPASGDKCLNLKLNSLSDKKINSADVFGINGNWNAMPRVPKLIGKDTYSVDLDNDNKQEVISITSSIDPKNKGTKNIKCFLKVNGKNILVSQAIVDGVYTKSFNIYTLDLNGDGKLEIITIEEGHNLNVCVKDYANGKIHDVLGFYQGD